MEEQVATSAVSLAMDSEIHNSVTSPLRERASKHNSGKRDRNTNNLIALVKLFVDICSQTHSSLSSVLH